MTFEVKDLADSVAPNEFKETQEALKDPAQKKAIIDYLTANADKNFQCIEANMKYLTELEKKWDVTKGENPYKGAEDTYKTLFAAKTAIDTDALQKNLENTPGSKSLTDALKDIDGAALAQSKETEGAVQKLRDHLQKGEYGAALLEIMNILFIHNKDLEFSAFSGKGFPQLSESELAAIYEQGKDITNPKIAELKKQIAETPDVNRKLSLGFVVTQIEDYIAEKNAGKQLSDMELLAPKLQKGSIIMMRQERTAAENLTKIGDAGLILNDNKTIADFTHIAVVSEAGADPVITHSTGKDGVHKENFTSYLNNFSHTNIVVLNPSDINLGNTLADKCNEKLGMHYDPKAPVEEFLSGINLPKGGENLKDDATKTNCVEFIADALFDIDKNNKDLENKAHPNDMLAATKSGYNLDYVKTYVKDKKENSARNQRMATAQPTA